MKLLFFFVRACELVLSHMNTNFYNLDYKPLHLRRLELDESSNSTSSGANETEAVKSLNEKWQCPSVQTEYLEIHNKYKLRMVNLGSWMVLEPWITPTLFFQFLGKEVEPGSKDNSQDSIGMDMYTFCKALGPDEGNRQLKAHWDSWVTENDIAQLATMGINSVRVPVGDWMYKPYGPYIGCTDGALDQMERLFKLCKEYGLKVLLDIHAINNSQNGFDNSGRSMSIEWTTYSSTQITGSATFVHWPFRTAEWMGQFDSKTATYTTKNETNIQHTLDTIQVMIDMYSNETAVLGIEPVNEPWQFTPLDWLKQFYWDSYEKVREGAPHWLFLMHDAFMFDVEIWGDFMLNCPNIGLDTHIYQAWFDPMPQASFLRNACKLKTALQKMEYAGMPVVVGEWSLATDNCAMWLNGFNDNVPGFPRVQCSYTTCPLPYMGPGIIPGAPVNPNMPPQGPFGTGSSTPSYGQCPVDKEWHNNDIFMKDLARAKLYAFDSLHGWAFWNFKNELEPRWSYIAATDLEYFPQSVADLENDFSVQHACDVFLGLENPNGFPEGIYATTNYIGKNQHNLILMVSLASMIALGAVLYEKYGHKHDGFVELREISA